MTMEPDMLLLVAVCILTAIVCACFIFLVVLYLTSSPNPDLRRHDSECYFIDPKQDNRQLPFPSLDDQASVELSVIVPAYNEEARLPKMLDEAFEHLEALRRASADKFTYEIIVVNDGSRDRTTQIALAYSAKFGTEKMRVLTFVHNRGKGGAVRFGMLSARGRLLLFADADGATRFSDVDKLVADIHRIERSGSVSGEAVVCGSRAHLERESIAKRSVFRTFLMLGFHFLVAALCVRKVRDTQCGFKLLTRPAAKLLFTNLHVDRWAFDVDLLYIAQHFGVAISEVPVMWHEVDGSKLVPIFSWLQMAKDLSLIRLRYTLGVWKLTRKHKGLKVE